MNRELDRRRQFPPPEEPHAIVNAPQYAGPNKRLTVHGVCDRQHPAVDRRLHPVEIDHIES